MVFTVKVERGYPIGYSLPSPLFVRLERKIVDILVLRKEESFIVSITVLHLFDRLRLKLGKFEVERLVMVSHRVAEVNTSFVFPSTGPPLGIPIFDQVP